jgi:hypothetical protein
MQIVQDEVKHRKPGLKKTSEKLQGWPKKILQAKSILHQADNTQIFLGQFPDFISRDEAANSPDLNPLDYSVWSILEAKACAKPHKVIESLKRALIQAWDEITTEILAKIIDNFPKRLEQCIKAKGCQTCWKNCYEVQAGHWSTKSDNQKVGTYFRFRNAVQIYHRADNHIRHRSLVPFSSRASKLDWTGQEIRS